MKKEEKVIVSATLESISLMPDGAIGKTYTNVVFGVPDSNGDLFAPGCFDESIEKSKGKFKLTNKKYK